MVVLCPYLRVVELVGFLVQLGVVVVLDALHSELRLDKLFLCHQVLAVINLEQ